MEPLVELSFEVEETNADQAADAADSPVHPLVLHPPHDEFVDVTFNCPQSPQTFARFSQAEPIVPDPGGVFRDVVADALDPPRFLAG